jgi:hypothetical protein
MANKPITREEFRSLMADALNKAYEDYPEEWLQLFEQGGYRPPWYKRLWRWFFPKPVLVYGLGAPPEDKQ